MPDIDIPQLLKMLGSTLIGGKWYFSTLNKVILTMADSSFIHKVIFIGCMRSRVKLLGQLEVCAFVKTYYSITMCGCVELRLTSGPCPREGEASGTLTGASQ